MACNKALVLMITLNILFFTLVSSTSAYPPNPASAPPPVSTTPPPKPSTLPPLRTKPSTFLPSLSTTPPPKPASAPPPVSPNSCPIDTVPKLNVCANLLTIAPTLNIPFPQETTCCKVISGLVDLEAAVCLCTVLKAQLLGSNINIPIGHSSLINLCGKKVPSGFQCAK